MARSFRSQTLKPAGHSRDHRPTLLRYAPCLTPSIRAFGAGDGRTGGSCGRDRVGAAGGDAPADSGSLDTEGDLGALEGRRQRAYDYIIREADLRTDALLTSRHNAGYLCQADGTTREKRLPCQSE